VSRSRISPDQIALGAGVVALLLAVAWSVWAEGALSNIGARPANWVGNDAVTLSRLPGPPTADLTSAADWAAPAPQGGRTGWVFDLFTPPVIYYSADTGRFSVSAPSADENVVAEVARQAFGVQLHAVQRQPFRLQLVGYAGEPGDYLGIFQNEVSGEAIVARNGHRFDDLGLRIQDLNVRREDLLVPDSMPLREIVAVAEVWDETAGRAVRLSSAGWQWLEAPAAELEIEATGARHVLRSGDFVEAGETVFEVLAINVQPASVTIGKRHGDDARETVVLVPNETSPITDETPLDYSPF
jgi:hypothetical protein